MLFKQAVLLSQKIISDFEKIWPKLAKNFWFDSYYNILNKIGIGYDEACNCLSRDWCDSL
jgi:hypothetical protein